MFYAIPDTLLKVSLNTNKTGHHVIPDTLLKVVLKHHFQQFVRHNMVTSFIGV
jgi:hypothetical protein